MAILDFIGTHASLFVLAVIAVVAAALWRDLRDGPGSGVD